VDDLKLSDIKGRNIFP